MQKIIRENKYAKNLPGAKERKSYSDNAQRKMANKECKSFVFSYQF